MITLIVRCQLREEHEHIAHELERELEQQLQLFQEQGSGESAMSLLDEPQPGAVPVFLYESDDDDDNDDELACSEDRCSPPLPSPHPS